MPLMSRSYRPTPALPVYYELVEQARTQRRKYAQETFRESASGMPRMDAVMYLVGALEKFDGMATAEVQKIAFES